MYGDPWGNSAHSALSWAYGLLARSESTPTVFGEWAGGTKRHTGMTMLDHRAQGAIIRKIVDDRVTDVPEHAILVACYLPKPVRERAAGGGMQTIDRWLPARQAAVYDLAWWLLGQEGAGSDTLHGYREIVSQYTLSRLSIKRLASLLGTRRNKAKAAREAAFGKLEELHERALLLAEGALARAGLLSE